MRGDVHLQQVQLEVTDVNSPRMDQVSMKVRYQELNNGYFLLMLAQPETNTWVPKVREFTRQQGMGDYLFTYTSARAAQGHKLPTPVCDELTKILQVLKQLPESN